MEYNTKVRYLTSVLSVPNTLGDKVKESDKTIRLSRDASNSNCYLSINNENNSINIILNDKYIKILDDKILITKGTCLINGKKHKITAEIAIVSKDFQNEIEELLYKNKR